MPYSSYLWTILDRIRHQLPELDNIELASAIDKVSKGGLDACPELKGYCDRLRIEPDLSVQVEICSNNAAVKDLCGICHEWTADPGIPYAVFMKNTHEAVCDGCLRRFRPDMLVELENAHAEFNKTGVHKFGPPGSTVGQ